MVSHSPPVGKPENCLTLSPAVREAAKRYSILAAMEDLASTNLSCARSADDCREATQLLLQASAIRRKAQCDFLQAIRDYFRNAEGI